MKKHVKESFEDYLKRTHMEDEPMVLDDDLPEAYESWLERTSQDLMIAYAEAWHTEQLIANLEYGN